MRKTRKSRIALIAGFGLAMIAAVALTVGPAYSADRETAAAEAKAPATAESDVQVSQPRAEAEPTQERQLTTADVDAEGYEWCASRATANRYLWSHRPS